MDPLFVLTQERREYSVGDLTAEIAALLSDAYTGVWVRGEVSGLKMAASGHAYFTLKDDRASIRCACWKGSYRFLRHKPKDGAEVLARGRIEVYEPRGDYQLIVDAMEAVGAGALQEAFEKLKKRLAAEGLFDAGRKRPLPGYPRRIGIVTSPGGAVVRDMLNVMERRFRGLHVRIYPSLVQGAGAAEQIIQGIEFFSSGGWADLIVVARGGGSIEDLWTFNEEAVARAIAGASVPVVSAVGHETDFTIADFVADLRAATPSAAAELITCEREGVLQQIGASCSRLKQAVELRLARAARRLGEIGAARGQVMMERRLFRAGQRLDDAAAALRNVMPERLRANREKLEQLDSRLRLRDMRLQLAATRLRLTALDSRNETAIRRRWNESASRFQRLAEGLKPLNPLQILERGFAVVTLPGGGLLRAAENAPAGTSLTIRLSSGRIRATSEGFD